MSPPHGGQGPGLPSPLRAVDDWARIQARATASSSSVYLVLSSLYLFFPDPAPVEATGESAESGIALGAPTQVNRGSASPDPDR